MDIKVRLADISDADLLLEWRQDPVTVANSHSTVAIDHDEHIKWFESRLSSDLSIILMGYFSDYNEPIGMVRFDKTEDQIWSVSINLSRMHRGKGLSSALLNAATENFRLQHTAVLVASVKPNNVPSRKCFEACGFGLYLENDSQVTYVNKALIIDEIEKVRQRNNVNWMNLMRLAFSVAPLEAEKIFQNVNEDDGKIADLLNILTHKVDN